MVKAVIFDLDGTLIDSAPDIQAAANKMLMDTGLDPLDLKTIISFTGNGLPKFVERLLDHCDIDQTHYTSMLDGIMSIYLEASHNKTVFYPGAESLLHDMHRNGVKLGICTNKPHKPAHKILKHFEIIHLFDSFICGDSLPTKKPDPAPLIQAIKQLGETDVLYVGDSPVDYATAQNAAIPFALFTGGYHEKPLDYFENCWHFDTFDQLRQKPHIT